MSGKIIQLKKATAVAGSDDLIVEEVTISPSTAAQWLKANRHNRPVRRRHVEFLADEIRSGNWQVNGQAIIIAEDEQILDGQHRLMAVIEAGDSIRSLVIYGVSPEAFKTIDTGAVRSGADSIALSYPGFTRQASQTASAAISYCMLMEREFLGRKVRVSNTEILAYAEEHPSLFNCAETVLKFPKDARPMPLGASAALYEMFSRKHSEQAEAFMTKLLTGENLGMKEPEYVLRELFIKDSRRLRGYPVDAKMRMCVKAWNWRRRGHTTANRQTVVLHPNEPARLCIL